MTWTQPKDEIIQPGPLNRTSFDPADLSAVHHCLQRRVKVVTHQSTTLTRSITLDFEISRILLCCCRSAITLNLKRRHHMCSKTYFDMSKWDLCGTEAEDHSLLPWIEIVAALKVQSRLQSVVTYRSKSSPPSTITTADWHEVENILSLSRSLSVWVWAGQSRISTTTHNYNRRDRGRLLPSMFLSEEVEQRRLPGSVVNSPKRPRACVKPLLRSWRLEQKPSSPRAS